MATGEKVYIADKKTVDEIYTLLLSSEIGLAVLKELLSESTSDNETIAASISTLGENIGIVQECITDNANGLGAIKEAVTGRANETTVEAVKALLENGTYGLNALKTAIASDNETIAAGISTLGENIGIVQECITDNANGLSAIKEAVTGRANESTSTEIKGLLENGTYGLAALKTAITGRANESTATAIKALLENGTYGLNALDKDLGTIAGYLTNTTYGLNALKTAITGNVKTIKSVQHGTFSCSSAATSYDSPYTVTISSVNISKSFIITRTYSSGWAVVRLKNETTLAINTNMSVNNCIEWQVIEFY